MAHRQFEFDMPASAEVVSDAFHFHHWRLQWDSWIQWLLEPIVVRMFDWQTRKRFTRLQAYIQRHREEIERWQATQA